MKEALVYIIVTGITFICFLVSIIWGLIKGKRNLIILSLLFLFISITSGVITVYKTATKTYHKVTDLLEPRTGAEIYQSLFGSPKLDCVKVLKSQDQVIPKIDYAIWLHFTTCPKELQRILDKKKFVSRLKSTNHMNSDGPLADDNWFKPENMGDTIIIFTSIDAYENGQEIFCNMDSNEVFLKDILD